MGGQPAASMRESWIRVKKFQFCRKISEKFRFFQAIIFTKNRFLGQISEKVRFLQVISQKNSICKANFRKISIFLDNFTKYLDFPSKNWLFTAISGQIILFLFKSHHFRTYFLYMIRYNNILRPVHDPPTTPPPPPNPPPPRPQNRGGRAPH